MTFWVPLEPHGPEAPARCRSNGSHRMGVMGDYTTYGDGDALTAFPELQDLEDVGPGIHYELGDVTVHTHLTIHGAGANRMDRPRWAWLLVVQPEDAAGTARRAPTSTTL